MKDVLLPDEYKKFQEALIVYKRQVAPKDVSGLASKLRKCFDVYPDKPCRPAKGKLFREFANWMKDEDKHYFQDPVKRPPP